MIPSQRRDFFYPGKEAVMNGTMANKGEILLEEFET
jgi:hypothetical protein